MLQQNGYAWKRAARRNSGNMKLLSLCLITELVIVQRRGNGNEKRSYSRFQRLKMAFADPMPEAHLPFFNAALPLFTHFNAFFCKEVIHNVTTFTHPMIKDLGSKLATRFLKAELLDDVFLDTLENVENFLPLSETNIGLSAKMKLVDLYEEGSITSDETG